LSPARRPAIVECREKLKEFILHLRLFLDEDDYWHVERAYEINQLLKNPEYHELMAGYEDLDRNVTAMYQTWKEKNGQIDSILHAHLSDQAVYTITRANLIFTGLEFKLKRMRKG